MDDQKKLDYGNLVKCIAEKNLFSEHFSDLRSVEHAEYLKTITSYLLSLQEIQEKHYENNDLIREVEEYILLDENITKQLEIYKEKTAALEEEIAQLNENILELCQNYVKRISDLAGKIESLEVIYHLKNIKLELVNVQSKKDEITKQIIANKAYLNQMENKFDQIHIELPNFKGVFEEDFEKENIKKQGDLATNKKLLADLKNSYNELSKKIENLKQY